MNHRKDLLYRGRHRTRRFRLTTAILALFGVTR